MVLKRTSHAIYDTRYHAVWAPKYWKWIRREDIRHRAGELFREIAQELGFEIEELEVARDQVYVFLNFPPKYALGKVVGILKRLSARRLVAEYSELKAEWWGGEFWEDGYFVRTVGDQVTAEVIKKYIRYHQHEEHQGPQLELF